MLDKFINAAMLSCASLVLIGVDEPPAPARAAVQPTVSIPILAPRPVAPIPNAITVATKPVSKPVVQPAAETQAKTVPVSLRGDCENGQCQRPAKRPAKAVASVARGFRGNVSERRGGRVARVLRPFRGRRR